MIVDELLLGRPDRTLHRMQLLCNVEAGPAGIEHPDHLDQVSVGATQPLGHFRVRFVQGYIVHGLDPTLGDRMCP